jgi:hypothetical protein
MNLYGIFIDDSRNPRWGMCRNKRQAIRLAKRNPGATVRALKDLPEYHSFDAPTFKVLSTQVWPEDK